MPRAHADATSGRCAARLFLPPSPGAVMAFGDDIYQEHVLEHYETPYHRGHCQHPTHAHEDRNPLCGDRIHLELELSDDGRIEAIYFDGEGCCISQASASMLAEALEGKSVAEVQNFSARDMLELFGPRLTPNRQKCCLLAWRVLQVALHGPLKPAAED